MAKHAEAAERAKRTFIQGALVTAIIAVCGATVQIIGSWSHSEFTDVAAWSMYLTSAVQAAVTSIASYLHKRLDEHNE